MDKLTESINDHESRLSKLEEEYAGNIHAIFEILKGIEKRLLGGFENNSIGLIEESRNLRKDLDDIGKRITQMEAGIESIRETIVGLSKYKYIVYGGIIVITWLFSNLGSIWGFLTGGSP